ncbi:GntR family transcriptional regulator [Verrucomicrobium spinosum]|uniref:GntR family transcriptional regulator n=1 Tax=Verrucomicrobium spinosum TaxID=2736 RepID=UPI000174534A|nr:GntR family transcriptional regulator [Verrucomicrobium spinosum]
MNLPSALSPVPRLSLAHTVRTQLSEAILSGELAPGQHVPEPELASRLGVSRAPVREALLELERHGLVTFDARGRTHIVQLTLEDMEEIYSLRLALEPLAAGLTTERGTAEVFASLEANIAATERASSLAEVTRLDAAFHDLIMQASGHRRAARFWEGLRYQVEAWLGLMQRRHQAVFHSTQAETVKAHKRLLKVLRSGDAAAAEEEMKKHIVSWRRWLALEADAAARTDRKPTL